MRVRTLAAVAALALGTAISGGAAHATTYLLDTSATFGTGNFGQVTVSGTSTDLHFDVLLDPAYTFVDTGGHYAFSGNLAGTVSTMTLSLPATETGDFTLSTSTTSGLSNSPYTGFDIALNCQPTACGNGASPPQFGNELIFDILGSGLSVEPADPYGSPPETIYFAADVYGPVVGTGQFSTGTIAGGPTMPVPEPATWGLMITGVFFIGAAMRQRRYRALVTA